MNSKNQIRNILKNKAHLRTKDKRNITKYELLQEARVLMSQREREVFKHRYLGSKIHSYIKVSMETYLSESSVKRIESKCIDKIARVIESEYLDAKYIRSGELFMLYSDEIMESMERVDSEWRGLTVEERKERIRAYILEVQEENSEGDKKWWYEETLRLLELLESDKLEYFLDIHHRLIMLHAEDTILKEQLEAEERGLDEEERKKRWELEMAASKEYEECSLEEKYNRQYDLAKHELIKNGFDSYTDIEELTIEDYEGEPIDILIKLKKLTGEALEEYINTLPPIDLVDEVIDDGMTPSERRLNITINSLREALEAEGNKEGLMELDNVIAHGLGLEGDYAGIGFGKSYSNCTLSEKVKRQLNFYTDMMSDEVREAGLDMSIIEDDYKKMYGLTFQDIVTKLTMLQGEELESFIEILPSVGDGMGIFEDLHM